MKKKKLTIGYKKKKVKLVVEDCNNWRKFSGLMFSRKEKAGILLFGFKQKQKIAIHSFFVFYPFLAVWLDEKRKVVDVKKVKPFTPCVYPKKNALSLVEIPLNKRNERIARVLISDDESS